VEAALAGDISADLDHVRCPTMIGHCTRDAVVPVSCARYLARRLPQATLRLWDDANHAFNYSKKWRQIQDDIIEFATGSRPEPAHTTRFATILFTDIVASTARSRAAGDEAWARLIRAHDATADLVLANRGGRRVKSTGDGLLALFDDPGQAVTGAREVQHELAALGIEIRGGLHAGQVELQPDGDVTGIAVNIAARVESVAPPVRSVSRRP